MQAAQAALPTVIDSVEQLDDVLTNPNRALCEMITTLASPLVILGAGGKMGPSLAVLAKRAAQAVGHSLEVIAVSRFRNADARRWLEERDVKVISADFFDAEQLANLPDASNVIYLVGMKFGTTSDPVPTWITNTLGPIHASQRYPGSRIVALSTGNVYPLVDLTSRGSVESDPLTPIGEYPNAAVARERIFQHYASSAGSLSPTTLIRLNYAHDLRYGVISDIAGKISRGEPVDVSMPAFNAIWQGDANEFALRAFGLCSTPATALNVTGTTHLRVRDIATRLAKLLSRDLQLVGNEQPTALLSDSRKMAERFGEPRVPIEQLVDWIAHWTKIGGLTYNKPTHFESRDGNF